MAYSQKPLLELMKAGNFPGETGQPTHIQTVISNVFIFDDTVYKLYKNDNDFFNKGFRDLSAISDRFNFTEKDYNWNSTLSPSIHIRLAPVAVRDGAIVEVDSPDAAEELMIVMCKVDTNNVLYKKLTDGEITEEDCFEIGRQLGESMKKIQIKPAQPHNFYDSFRSRIQDVRIWIKSVTEYISAEESDAYCDFLEAFRTEHRSWFENELSAHVTTDGDFHSHNAIYAQGAFHLIDTYPPKESWGVGHRLIGMYRIGTDIWALSGKREFFESFIKGYEAGRGILVDRRLDDLYIIYASGIALSYLYMLQRTDPDKKESAERFHAFVREYFSKIK